jgi:RNA polymerase sigma-70 factor (ECF subfamily)
MSDVAAGERLTAAELEVALEHYRRELTGYCYRMLGSAFEAEDAVQETMVKAWRAYERFEGRSSLRSWLYRIATNVCLDALDSRNRRARPMDMGPSQRTVDGLGPILEETAWLQPIPDSRVLPTDGDPAELAVARESIRLAFVAALQYLPPRQRAVLILREVLRWKAAEVAELLDTSVPSVNSALQRARATLDERAAAETEVYRPLDPGQQAVLARYVDAFERYDMESLVTLLHEDVVLSMPPYNMWLRGQDEVLAWMTGPGYQCAGSKLIPVLANGTPAYAQYRDGGDQPWALQVLEIVDGRIVGINAFLDTPTLFPLFDMLARLDHVDR